MFFFGKLQIYFNFAATNDGGIAVESNPPLHPASTTGTNGLLGNRKLEKGAHHDVAEISP